LTNDDDVKIISSTPAPNPHKRPHLINSNQATVYHPGVQNQPITNNNNNDVVGKL